MVTQSLSSVPAGPAAHRTCLARRLLARFDIDPVACSDPERWQQPNSALFVLKLVLLSFNIGMQICMDHTEDSVLGSIGL